MPKGKKLGSRVTVAVGKDKTGKTLYAYPLLSSAEYFGLPYEKSIVTRKGKKGGTVAIRGSKGDKSIKIPTSQKGKNGATKHKAFPMPGGMTIAKIGAFLKKASKNKPKYFVSADGRSWPVA